MSNDSDDGAALQQPPRAFQRQDSSNISRSDTDPSMGQGPTRSNTDQSRPWLGRQETGDSLGLPMTASQGTPSEMGSQVDLLGGLRSQEADDVVELDDGTFFSLQTARSACAIGLLAIQDMVKGGTTTAVSALPSLAKPGFSAWLTENSEFTSVYATVMTLASAGFITHWAVQYAKPAIQRRFKVNEETATNIAYGIGAVMLLGSVSTLGYTAFTNPQVAAQFYSTLSEFALGSLLKENGNELVKGRGMNVDYISEAPDGTKQIEPATESAGQELVVNANHFGISALINGLAAIHSIATAIPDLEDALTTNPNKCIQIITATVIGAKTITDALDDSGARLIDGVRKAYDRFKQNKPLVVDVSFQIKRTGDNKFEFDLAMVGEKAQRRYATTTLVQMLGRVLGEKSINVLSGFTSDNPKHHGERALWTQSILVGFSRLIRTQLAVEKNLYDKEKVAARRAARERDDHDNLDLESGHHEGFSLGDLQAATGLRRRAYTITSDHEDSLSIPPPQSSASQSTAQAQRSTQRDTVDSLIDRYGSMPRPSDDNDGQNPQHSSAQSPSTNFQTFNASVPDAFEQLGQILRSDPSNPLGIASKFTAVTPTQQKSTIPNIPGRDFPPADRTFLTNANITVNIPGSIGTELTEIRQRAYDFSQNPKQTPQEIEARYKNLGITVVYAAADKTDGIATAETPDGTLFYERPSGVKRKAEVVIVLGDDRPANARATIGKALPREIKDKIAAGQDKNPEEHKKLERRNSAAKKR